jgi:response regulator RpfG family c-di-GMP phosphodiesterase
METGKERPIVLVVDDEPINIEVMARGLGKDYEALAATGGKEALDIAARYVPDLIILDVSMPEMDGYETFRCLKEIEALKNVPVIFVTALGAEEYELHGLELGAADYIIKPIKPALVKQRVGNILELKAKSDLLAERALELQDLNRKLQVEIENVKTLRGLLPICCVCKKIRDDKGYWNQLEIYISQNTDAEFSHGYCPECLKKALDDMDLKRGRTRLK